MGPRANEIHVPAKDVEELRQLIEQRVAGLELPEQPAEARDPIAVVGRPLGVRPAARVHGAELDQPERPARQPHALLDEEHGPPGVELDQEGDQPDDGGQDE